ncbi:MAG: NAD(P)-binding domain-containing protein [Betaproteobacteria bacterium]|nr:NAD(P)-binding domain-containing protein [Betaproteobacteria bacterium]MBK9609342.1 NAD(P)-binding domain-containing protein [Betaproteobacteria bacterium]
MTRLGIIGTGRLGATLLRAAAIHAPAIGLAAASRDPARVAALQREIPRLAAASPEDLARACDLVVLCVPNDACLPLAERIAGHLGPGAIVISVSNTVPLAAIAERVRVPVVKVIPTLAHVVGRGVALLVAGPGAGPAHVEAVRGVFAHFSLPLLIDERDARVASNVGGSALALFAALCDMFVAANAARAQTLERATLDAMMAETAAAVAALAQAGHGWNDIVGATATPGGMTHAALEILASGFPRIAEDMVEATFATQAALAKRAGGAP